MAQLLPLLFLVSLALIGGAIALVVAFIARLRFSVPGAQGADAGELRAYVHNFSRTLSTLGVSRSARRRHVDELKANLAEAVAADGTRAALAGLGPAGALATGYADYRPRPAWLVGVVASALTWVAVVFVNARCGDAYGVGLTQAYGVAGFPVSGNTVDQNGWGVTFDAVLNGGVATDVHVSSPWIWILPIAAFFIVSRSWRVLALRNAATVKA